MMRSVINEGTGAGVRSAGFVHDAAGKTGTTNDLRDAWFIGFTPELLTAVWVGLDSNQPIGLSGAQAALPIWTAFMKRALAGRRNATFPTPPDIAFADVDKVNGKPMFYANPSIKKANIGYRGAWAAFGVEYNFPVSHNWMSLSPIDFAFSQNADGSASVIVGNVDRVYGMHWTVEMLLHPKSTVLEQRVILSNRSDVRHRFYWWNNAAVEVWDDSRVQYPMRFAASHGFAEVQPWPMDSTGRDLSIIRNQTDGPVSLFSCARASGWPSA
jgi:membrane carboxypeptidase/penicillin-binding protein PbpC